MPGKVRFRQAADKFPFKSGQRLHAGKRCHARKLFSLLNDAVFVNQKHDNRSGVESARLPPAGDFSPPPQFDKFLIEMADLRAGQERLQQKHRRHEKPKFQHDNPRFPISACQYKVCQYQLCLYAHRYRLHLRITHLPPQIYACRYNARRRD